MAISLKNTTKTDLKIKGVTVNNGNLFIDGEKSDLCEIMIKAFGSDTLFDISMSEKSEEEIDIDLNVED